MAYTKYLFLLCLLIAVQPLQAQQNTPVSGEPVFNQTFGNGDNPGPPLAEGMTNLLFTPCPNDGEYTIVNSVPCHTPLWHYLTTDHTGDKNGYFMLVNASMRPGTFYNQTINNLVPGTRYEFTAWILNLSAPRIGGPKQFPSIRFKVEHPDGTTIATFSTGRLPVSHDVMWNPERLFFTIPDDVTKVVLILLNESYGGEGNDLAVDDITIRPVAEITPAIAKQTPTKVAPPLAGKNSRTKESITITKKDSSLSGASVGTPVPTLLRVRKNVVVKTIATPASEMEVSFYDNGEVDGDTISIYVNGKLIAAHQGLSLRPVSIKVKMGTDSADQEITMVAENLGRIPPNTALMIVYAAGQRYDLRLSSSEDTNAVVRFHYEPVAGGR